MYLPWYFESYNYKHSCYIKESTVSNKFLHKYFYYTISTQQMAYHTSYSLKKFQLKELLVLLWSCLFTSFKRDAEKPKSWMPILKKRPCPCLKYDRKHKRCLRDWT